MATVYRGRTDRSPKKKKNDKKKHDKTHKNFSQHSQTSLLVETKKKQQVRFQGMRANPYWQTTIALHQP
jgi:hypothetical protein